MINFIDPVNAFSQFMINESEELEGPLKGYKGAVKDVFSVKGYRIQAGNPDFFNKAYIADQTAPAVSILQKGGAEFIGRTHTDELGGSLFGVNEHYGTPINFHSPTRMPGGSSSGSAAAVAAGLVDFSLGGDTSGSVRAPASFCGIYGFRPTLGRISTEGILPISRHLDTVGIFACHPKVISQILNVYEITEKQEFSRLRIIRSLVDNLEESLKKPFLEKLNKIKNLIDSEKSLIIEDEQLANWSNIIRIIAMHDLWQVHKEWIIESNPTFGQLISDRIAFAKSIKFEDYKQALIKKNEITNFLKDNLESGDIALFPTVHDIPPLLSTCLNKLKDFALKTSRHTCIAALSGFPEISIPIRNIKDNCSLGLSLIGKSGTDQSLALFSTRVHSLLMNGDH